MEKITGIELPKFPLNGLEKVSDLIYFEGPLLSHFINNQGDNYLYYWCDLNENYNRWIILRITSQQLDAFVNNKISLRQLILNPIDGILYCADMDNDLKLQNVWIVYPKDLPESYTPDPDSKYDFQPQPIEIDLLELSERYNSNLLNLHLKRGHGIGYGTALVSILGEFLTDFTELTNNITQNVLDSQKILKGRAKKEIKKYGEFEIVDKRAASFSLILRPLVNQAVFSSFIDRQQEVIESVFFLFANSKDYETLKNLTTKYDEKVLTSYQKILQYLSTQRIEVGFKWANLETKSIQSEFFNLYQSQNILRNINELDYSREELISYEGDFSAINLKTRAYTLVDHEHRMILSQGKFSQNIIEKVKQVSFQLTYIIQVKRGIAKKSGKKKPQIDDTIYSLKVKENLGSIESR